MFFKPKKKPTSNQTTDERALARILLKCNCNLERVVEYILAAVDDPAVCKYCAGTAEGKCDSGLTACAAAATAYLKERDGHD